MGSVRTSKTSNNSLHYTECVTVLENSKHYTGKTLGMCCWFYIASLLSLKILQMSCFEMHLKWKVMTTWVAAVALSSFYFNRCSVSYFILSCLA